MSQDKRFLYLIRSEPHPGRHYTGPTSDVASRLVLHNSARSGHTIDHRPCHLVVAVECADERTARPFERYLKSDSGRAFAKRHFDPDRVDPKRGVARRIECGRALR